MSHIILPGSAILESFKILIVMTVADIDAGGIASIFEAPND